MLKKMDSVGNTKPVEPERNDWGYPTHDTQSIGQVVNSLTKDWEALSKEQENQQLNIDDLTGRIDELEDALHRANANLSELAGNCDALVKLMKQIATS